MRDLPPGPDRIVAAIVGAWPRLPQDTMARELKLLCAGAAQGLVQALAPRLQAETGASLGGRFGAVGAMKEALLDGAPCDLMVLSDPMVDLMIAEGLLRAEGRAPLGRVRTGLAVPRGAPRPDVSTAEALAAALLAADAIYFPDPERSTAGIHFISVLRQLELEGPLAPGFRTFPNGATAMRELAAAASRRPIGCTQVSEILYSDGVELVAALPQRFELATVYTAAVPAQSTDPALAECFVRILAAPDAAALRAASGFET